MTLYNVIQLTGRGGGANTMGVIKTQRSDGEEEKEDIQEMHGVLFDKIKVILGGTTMSLISTSAN